MIPIFKVSGNELTSLTGEVSSFYEIELNDLDALDEHALRSVIKEVELDLNTSTDDLKFYWIGKKLYLNLFGDLLPHSLKLSAVENPLSIIGDTSTISVYENYLTLGNEFIRILSIKEFPDQLSPLEIQEWCDFSLHLRRYQPLKAKKILNLKRKLHFSSLFKGLRDLDGENAFNQAEGLLQNVTTGTEGLFLVELFLILRAGSKEDLDQKSDEVLNSFKLKNSDLISEERGLGYFFLNLLPGVRASFKRAENCPGEFLSHLIPLHQDRLMLEGMELFSRHKTPMYFNLFCQEALNYNVLITGTSGQGKSMMANHLLRHEYALGTKAVVFDLGNSFSKVSRFLGGAVLSSRFNPLQFRNPRYLKEFILACIDEPMSRKNQGRLYEIIRDNIDSLNSFQDLLLILENDFPGISYHFTEIVEFFTHEEIPLNDLVYADFSIYPEMMKAPLVIFLIEYFLNLKGRKIFIFDECWHLLSKNADYIAECFRTFRKHQGSAVAISQNLDDFEETQLGRVIIQNTFYKFLFRQSLKKCQFVTDHDLSRLQTVKSKKGSYSEFLCLSEICSKIVRFYPDPLAYELYTSDKQDNLTFERYLEGKDSYLSFPLLMFNYVQIKYPKWGTNEKTNSKYGTDGMYDHPSSIC